MERDGREVVELELKYCERCGGLWLRRKGGDEVYCGRCLPKMAEYPARRKRKSEPRLPVGEGVEVKGGCENVAAHGAEGVRA